MVTFAYPWVLWAGLGLGILWFVTQWLRKDLVVYSYPLTDFFAAFHSTHSLVRHSHTILRFLRGCTLLIFVLLAARPQYVDDRSQVIVDGVDIILALDVSGSMGLMDDPRDVRTRIEISKQEAIKFIDRRESDSMGIVVFGADALSLCPLTLDKKLLKETVREILLGRVVNDAGTFMGAGLATSVNRLRASKAKSKVIVLLTDGCPTPGDFVDVDQAIEMAKIFNVKVYTIGVGSTTEAFWRDNMGHLHSAGNFHAADMKLLKKIADTTGGMCFEARKPDDLEKIYKTIDALEKTKQETILFSRRYEAFLPFMIAAIFTFLLEFILKFWWWRLPV